MEYKFYYFLHLSSSPRPPPRMPTAEADAEEAIEAEGEAAQKTRIPK